MLSIVDWYRSDQWSGTVDQSDDLMEDRHDYIQWLFPLTERSLAVPWAPVLTAPDLGVIRADPVIQDRMRVSTARMMLFYARTSAWKRANDHNHLRITRILKSLTLVGQRAEAEAFRAWLLRQGPDATAVTLRFWEEATG